MSDDEFVSCIIAGNDSTGKSQFRRKIEHISGNANLRYIPREYKPKSNIIRSFEMDYGKFGIDTLQLNIEFHEMNFSDLVSNYDVVMKTDIIYIMYDINDGHSFDVARDMVEQIKQWWDWDNTGVNAKIIVLICNKIDFIMKKDLNYLKH